MDYIEFCKAYYITTHIPVTLSKGSKPIFSSGSEILALEPSGILDTDLVPWELNPAFCRHSPDIEYGRIRIEGTDLNIVLGPMVNTAVTEQLVQAYIVETALPPKRRDDIRSFLQSIPQITHSRFAWHLNLVHMCVNGKAAELDELYGVNIQSIDKMIQRSVGKEELLGTEKPHSSYWQEQKLLQIIKEGDTSALKEQLSSIHFPISTGDYAQSPLRQAKDVFIVTITKAGMLGAIPGGVNIERVYQLSEKYIRECEQLQTIEAVCRLLLSMLQDFCQITNASKLPENVCLDIYAAVNFIRSNVGETISVEDVAMHIGRSPSYLANHFRQELGTSVGSYITACRLEKAKSLLRYTDRTLAEISSFLCFSSQSYFQNVFRKEFGVTPTEYRKKYRKS